MKITDVSGIFNEYTAPNDGTAPDEHGVAFLHHPSGTTFHRDVFDAIGAGERLDQALVSPCSLVGEEVRRPGESIADTMERVRARTYAEWCTWAQTRHACVPNRPSAAYEASLSGDTSDAPNALKRARTFRYTVKDGWADVDDFLSGDPKLDLVEALVQRGYRRAVTYGTEQRFAAEVWDSADAETEFPFIVLVNIGNSTWLVGVPRLPDLIALLNEVQPLSEAPITALVSCQPGWKVRGKNVLAYGLVPEVGVMPLVGSDDEDGGLEVAFGQVTWR